MLDTENIRLMLDTDRVDDAIKILKKHLQTNDNNDECHYLLGNAYCRKNDWKHAIESYCAAIDVNPKSPAVEAYKKVQEILNFYCHDLYNP